MDYAVGPPNTVFPAVLEFARKVQEKCLLHLQMDKTEVFSWDGVLPAGAPPGITLAGCNVEGVFCPGFVCYGIPVGSDGYVRHMLKEKVREVQEEMDKVKVPYALRQGACPRQGTILAHITGTPRTPRTLTTTKAKDKVKVPKEIHKNLSIKGFFP